jgi:AraC-like DNA-binding protein
MNVDRLCLAGHSLSDVESHSLVPATLSSLTDHVEVHARLRRLGACKLAVASTTSIRIAHTRRHVESALSELYKVVFQLSGSCEIEQGRHRTVVNAGHFCVFNATRPYTLVQSDAARFAVLVVPVNAISDWRKHTERSTSIVLPTLGLARLALSSAHYAVAADAVDDIDTAEGLETSITALLRAAIRQSVRATPQFELGRHDKLLDDAYRVIGKHHAYMLSVDDLARQVGVSRRTLFNAFAGSGQTPHEAIVRARVEAAKKALEDPMQICRSITDLSIAAGFSDAAHLNRLFRSAFGTTPTSYRKRFCRR